MPRDARENSSGFPHSRLMCFAFQFAPLRRRLAGSWLSTRATNAIARSM